MSLIVQKFGGTSVADAEKILSAARKAIRAQQEGHQVVMVVSAMGKNTDMLVGLANQVTERPPAREMDMLLSTGEQVSVALMAMAIDSLGSKAVSLTGGQIGIKTDSTHTKARIKSISTDRMKSLLDDGNIVIAAGFQGVDDDFNITTLGRGGSDTTAVALAAVLQADACEIYTDVDGVYTTDPRLLPEARHASQISYDEMLELASLGAGVMHSRAVEFAKKFDVPIHVRSSFSDVPGTMIVAEPESKSRAVSGAALTRDEARITVANVPDVPGSIWEIFSRIADKNVTVDMIVQNSGSDGKANISFTVPSDELAITLDAVADAAETLGGCRVTHDEEVSKVSVVGLGMAHQSGVAQKMFEALAAAEINLQMISTSEIKISVLVKREESQAALRVVHQAFDLHAPPDDAADPLPRKPSERPATSPIEVVSRLHADMEELLIDNVEHDSTQGSVTIRGVPDLPGLAAQIFREVANNGIIVDMIVQGYVGHGDANLSFTVPREHVASAVEITKRMGKSSGWEDVISSDEAAKLSVSGIGLRSHTGVAIRMFRAMADAKINLEMINTSEVRVNAVVEGSNGKSALQTLRDAFSDVFDKDNASS